MANDAPDWQRVVNITAGPALTDAPDWEKVVVGPGGSPVGGGGGAPGLLLPTDIGWAGWTCIPTLPSGTFAFSAGFIDGDLVKWAKSTTISKIGFYNNLAGVLTANENFLGVYSATPGTGPFITANLLASTAPGACDAPCSVVGYNEVALANPLAVTEGGFAYIVFLFNGTTMPTPNIYSYVETTTNPLVGFDWITKVGGYTTLPASLAAADVNPGGSVNYAYAL